MYTHNAYLNIKEKITDKEFVAAQIKNIAKETLKQAQEYFHGDEKLSSFMINKFNDVAGAFIKEAIEEIKKTSGKPGEKALNDVIAVAEALKIRDKVVEVEHKVGDDAIPFLVCFSLQKLSLGTVDKDFCKNTLHLAESLSKPILALTADQIMQNLAKSKKGNVFIFGIGAMSVFVLITLLLSSSTIISSITDYVIPIFGIISITWLGYQLYMSNL